MSELLRARAPYQRRARVMMDAFRDLNCVVVPGERIAMPQSNMGLSLQVCVCVLCVCVCMYVYT